MARQHGMRRSEAGAEGAVARTEVPDKLYFRIGEVARMCGVPTYVLRFWEGEFPQLRPGKGRSGQRLYRRSEVELALRVRGLLYEDGYTIAGARQMLRGEARRDEPDGREMVDAAVVRELRVEMRELLRMLTERNGMAAMREARRPSGRGGRMVREVECSTGNLFDRVEPPTAAREERDER